MLYNNKDIIIKITRHTYIPRQYKSSMAIAEIIDKYTLLIIYTYTNYI